MFIATRTLTLRTEAGNRAIAIRVFAPEADGTAWSCRYEIDWPEGTKATAAFGIDSVQSLQIALQMIGADLYTSAYHKSGKLAFQESGKGYGFPVPKNIRDLLVGDDATFFA
jgi:hypothetical protein